MGIIAVAAASCCLRTFALDGFRAVEWLRGEGVIDYIALPLLATDGTVHATSWTTKRPGGFSDEQLGGLRSLMPPLARVVEINIAAEHGAPCEPAERIVFVDRGSDSTITTAIELM